MRSFPVRLDYTATEETSELTLGVRMPLGVSNAEMVAHLYAVAEHVRQHGPPEPGEGPEVLRRASPVAVRATNALLSRGVRLPGQGRPQSALRMMQILDEALSADVADRDD